MRYRLLPWYFLSFLLFVALASVAPLQAGDTSEAAAITYSPETVDPDPIIQGMINQVVSSTVSLYDGGLSGEWPVIVNGQPYTLATRHTYSGEPIQKATQYVGQHMADLGLTVEYHQWGSPTYPNVIGEIAGAAEPENIYIISAHLDDMPSGSLAPGADDNASGSTAVLVAADIFSQYQWDCTLRFAFWTGEEQGLLGSAAYAQRSYDNGENILGVLNLDMIGWNTPGSNPDIDLHAKSTIPASVSQAQLFADVISTYNLDLVPQIITNGTGASDHASFWLYGYPAILGIEDYYGTGDFNPYYHTTQDRLIHLELDYFTEFVKASVGAFAHLSGCLVTEESAALDGQVTAANNGLPVAGALVTIAGSTGAPITTTTTTSGYYTATLSSGVYTVTVTAAGYRPVTVSNVTLPAGTVTTLDFGLERLYAIYLPVAFREN